MKTAALIFALVLVVALPFIFKKGESTVEQSDNTLVVITPHDEGIRFEFETAFSEYYESKTGRSIDIDWRVIGGTSEIIRYIQATYTNNFRNHWENELNLRWSADVQNGFANRKVHPAESPELDDTRQAAKRAFLASSVGCGLDVFFGGGSYDFIQQARAGTIVPFTTPEGLAAMLPETSIPMTFSGEPFYDKDARWVGAVLSQFGIIFNRDSLERLELEAEPSNWSSLADPKYLGELALADPTQSGSSTKAFEMIVQQRMLQLFRENPDPENDNAHVTRGWQESMQLIQLICANAKYFTDSSKKPSIDVSTGECAAGMSIDFYGRFQAETIMNRTGSNRFGYITPEEGSTVSVDPIAMFRGAPNPEIAKTFIKFVMSTRGQKLWNWKPGTPEGTIEYALRRSPMPRELYAPEFDEFRSDAGNNPYDEAGSFVYHPEWTARLFSPLRFIIKTAFIDPHSELTQAWEAIINAQNEGREADAKKALQVFQDLSRISYDEASGSIGEILSQRTKISEVKLARELTLHFTAQYQEAKRIAEGK
jgi:iron(III) transport system substrate-binding protein